MAAGMAIRWVNGSLLILGIIVLITLKNNHKVIINNR